MRSWMIGAFAASISVPAAAAPADGQLYFATIVSPSVKLYLDGKLLDEIPSGNVESFDITPGIHMLRAEGADRVVTERQLNFDRAHLADAKGGRWWCVISIPPKGGKGINLILMETAECKDFVESGN